MADHRPRTNETSFLLRDQNTPEPSYNTAATFSMMDSQEVSLQMSEVDELLTMLGRAQTLLKDQAGENVQQKSFLPHWLIRYLLLLSLIWQILCIGVLSIVDYKTRHSSKSAHHAAEIAINTILTVFTSVHLIVVILVTARVARKVASHTATFTFLIQSYLSTVLLFSGLYTLCTRFECQSFQHEQEPFDYCQSSKEIILIRLFIRYLYFSISNSTLCGITNLEPNKWYTELIVAFQMLLSFLYFTSILTQSYHHVKQRNISIWDSTSLLRKVKRIFIKVGS
ncbi:uncharacterized protein [Dysidea avara]|uniref:uncharacterized protein n=1 Tax=Dysidea avara TaxID=196820 RepID=UPI0033185BB2